LAIALLIFGEVLIIVAFVYFGTRVPSRILLLNISVSTLIYLLYASSLVKSKFNLNDKSQKVIGAIGIKGFIYVFYSLIAVGVMIAFNWYFPIELGTQLIVQLVLIFFLCLGIYFSLKASQKVSEVYLEQVGARVNLNEIRKSAKGIYLKLASVQNPPKDILVKLSAFIEDLRFISPSQNIEATKLELDFISALKQLNEYLDNNTYELEKITSLVETCVAIAQQRKQIYTSA